MAALGAAAVLLFGAAAASALPPPLYDQNPGAGGSDTGFAIVSQNSAANPQYVGMGADDFVVPATDYAWHVSRVDVTGQYFGASSPGTSPSVNVNIYNDNLDSPGSVVYTTTVGQVQGLGGVSTGDFTIPINATLAPGHYWVSVQANPNSNDAGGEVWGWDVRTPANNDQAMFENPSDGFGTGCTSWNTIGVCLPVVGPNDFMFALQGQRDSLTPSSGGPLSATEGSAMAPATLGTFTTTDPNATAGSYTATTCWNDLPNPPSDCTTSAVSGNTGGPFTVTGGHTFAEEGSPGATTTVTDAYGQSTTINTAVNVADAQLTATGLKFSVPAGKSFTKTVANFTDADPAGTTSDYSATINWGDGTGTQGGQLIAPNGTGGWSVTGSHKYMKPSNGYIVTVTVSDAATGTTTTSTGKATSGSK